MVIGRGFKGFLHVVGRVNPGLPRTTLASSKASRTVDPTVYPRGGVKFGQFFLAIHALFYPSILSLWVLGSVTSGNIRGGFPLMPWVLYCTSH